MARVGAIGGTLAVRTNCDFIVGDAATVGVDVSAGEIDWMWQTGVILGCGPLRRCLGRFSLTHYRSMRRALPDAEVSPD